MNGSNKSVKFHIAAVALLLAVGAYSVASFAASSGAGSINVTVGGSSGALGEVTAVTSSSGIGYVASTTTHSTTSSTATSIVLSGAPPASFKVGNVIQWGTNATTQRGYITAIDTGTNTLTVADVDGTTNTAPGTGATVYKVLRYAAQPSWSPVLNSAHAITGGDVYNVDTRAYTGNVLISLFLTNPDQLGVDYSYQNMKTNLWVLCHASGGCAKGTAPFAGSGTATQGSFVQATNAAGTSFADTPVYLSLVSGYLTFIVKGGYEYAVTIDGGSGYTINTDNACSTGNGCLSPTFFLELGPA